MAELKVVSSEGPKGVDENNPQALEIEQKMHDLQIKLSKKKYRLKTTKYPIMNCPRAVTIGITCVLDEVLEEDDELSQNTLSKYKTHQTYLEGPHSYLL